MVDSACNHYISHSWKSTISSVSIIKYNGIHKFQDKFIMNSGGWGGLVGWLIEKLSHMIIKTSVVSRISVIERIEVPSLFVHLLKYHYKSIINAWFPLRINGTKSEVHAHHKKLINPFSTIMLHLFCL